MKTPLIEQLLTGRRYANATLSVTVNRHGRYISRITANLESLVISSGNDLADAIENLEQDLGEYHKDLLNDNR